MPDLTITWLGHASVMLEGERTILLDPWIDGNPACDRALSDFTGVDLICVTHGHDDHLGDAIPLAKQTGARMLASPEICIYADKRGLPYDEGSFAMDIGGTYRDDACEITMVPAFHNCEILGEEFQRDKTVTPGAGAAGYVVRMDGGPGVYFSGDTGVFGDMALIAELYGPSVAILPAGGKYTMGPREVAHAAKLLRPAVLIPIHYDTFPNQAIDTGDLVRRIGQTSPRTRVVVLKPGESISL